MTIKHEKVEASDYNFALTACMPQLEAIWMLCQGPSLWCNCTHLQKPFFKPHDQSITDARQDIGIAFDGKSAMFKTMNDHYKIVCIAKVGYLHLCPFQDLSSRKANIHSLAGF